MREVRGGFLVKNVLFSFFGRIGRKEYWFASIGLGMTRQRENEEYEPRQLDYDTGLEMEISVRRKGV